MEDRVLASSTESFRIFQSYLKEDDIREIRFRFGIPDEFLIAVPVFGERPHSLPNGFTSFYMAHLEARLWFLIPLFFAKALAWFKVRLSKMVPKSFSKIAGFYI
ncbi:UNVERIFIED_CONTAM: hypothetical protein Sradi_3807900 [Sesamum radiatum]|uniref:Uncharacterized protein n=1 Tax=Sesamum radiatum TaxID=300843 RepID=A0AAW2Q0M2_SESRA